MLSLSHLYVLRCLACVYALIAVPCSLRGIYLWLTDPSFIAGASLPVCIAAAVAALVVFVRPWGGMIALGLLTTYAFGLAVNAGDAPAVAFHILVLAVLFGPLVLMWRAASPG